MEKDILEELAFKIAEMHVQYRDVTGIIMHPETAKCIFLKVAYYSTSYDEISSLKYRGIPIYRSLDIDKNEVKVF